MRRRLILLIDDSPFTLEVTGSALEAAGYQVRRARDLQEIAAARLGQSPDLVLLDVEMAEVFGDDLAWILREDFGQRPPIVMLSALPEAELAHRASLAGAQGYLSKRAGITELVRRVHLHLRDDGPPSPGAPPEMRLEFAAVASRRLRHAVGILTAQGAAALHLVGYELHALVGEAAIVGLGEIAELAQDARRAVDAAIDVERCAELLLDLEARVSTLDGALARAPSSPSAAPSRPLDGRSQRRILLVDDSDLYRASLGACIEDAGYQVVEAASLAQYRALDPGACDLVLLDLQLGDGVGTALVAELRARMPRAVIALLSGGDRLALPEGVDLYLHKTLDPTTLLLSIDHALGIGSTGV